jgi:hypothetical protein
VVIVKEVKGTSLFYMRVDGSSCAALVPLHCPPLPADSWLLWCEGGACDGDLSVVLVTVCGRERSGNVECTLVFGVARVAFDYNRQMPVDPLLFAQMDLARV